MTDYEKDRRWSDKHIPQIKELVGPLLLSPASFDEDIKHATDLMILDARDKRIAARVRRPGYYEKYPNDFTIRSARKNGQPTELQKMIDGFGDWFFYGHEGEDGRIKNWMLLDLHVWRAQLIAWGKARDGWTKYAREQTNKDNATSFFSFMVLDFPESILIGGHPLAPDNWYFRLRRKAA